MRSDRAPFDYWYLSRRLLSSLINQNDATRSRWRVGASLNATLATVDLSRAEPDRANLHALAVRAEKLVQDQTATLDSLTAVYYLRASLNLTYGMFEPLMGWQGGKVVCFAAETATPGGTPVYLALFGSASNLVGYRDNGGGEGYHPSDITGLYQLLDAVREPGDPEIDLDYRFDEGGLTQKAIAECAMSHGRASARTSIGLADILARVYIHREGELDYGRFSGHALVGTPMWVSTSHPQRRHRFHYGRRFARP